MNTFTFDPNAESVKDKDALNVALKLSTENVIASNALVFEEARLLFLQNKIPRFRIIYKRDDGIEEELMMDNNARLSNWPLGFCDRHDHILEDILLITL